MSYDLGHPADEGGGFPPCLCPLCGWWHTADACPLNSGLAPGPDEGPDPDPGPQWEDPGVDHPAWSYGQVIIPSDN